MQDQAYANFHQTALQLVVQQRDLSEFLEFGMDKLSQHPGTQTSAGVCRCCVAQ
jgi:hypothetical protein